MRVSIPESRLVLTSTCSFLNARESDLLFASKQTNFRNLMCCAGLCMDLCHQRSLNPVRPPRPKTRGESRRGGVVLSSRSGQRQAARWSRIGEERRAPVREFQGLMCYHGRLVRLPMHAPGPSSSPRPRGWRRCARRPSRLLPRLSQSHGGSRGKGLTHRSVRVVDKVESSVRWGEATKPDVRWWTAAFCPPPLVVPLSQYHIHMVLAGMVVTKALF